MLAFFEIIAYPRKDVIYMHEKRFMHFAHCEGKLKMTGCVSVHEKVKETLNI